jgi:hypothetical protein
LNYTFRMHDPRIGRFFAVDPLFKDYPCNSPYSFAENDVIAYAELEGGEKTDATSKAFVPATPVITKVGKDVTKELARKAAVSTVEGQGKQFVKKQVSKGIGEKILGTVGKGVGIVFMLLTDYASPNYGGRTSEMPMPDGTWPKNGELPSIPATVKAPEITSIPKTETPTSVTTEKDDDEEYIYRGGNPGNANLTPRPTKDTEGPKRGLSTFTTASEAKSKSGKKMATKISVNALKAQGLTVDYIGTHASIRPATQKELDDWAATKQKVIEGGDSHKNTKKVQAAVRGVE